MTNKSLGGLRAFPCPECGGGTEVIDSRPTTWMESRAVRRRRKCQADGNHRFSTFEVSEADIGKGQTLVPILRRAKNLSAMLVRALQGGDPWQGLQLEDDEHPQDQAGPR